MAERPKLGYVQFRCGKRSGHITIALDSKCPIRRQDIKPLTDKNMQRYQIEAGIYWDATLDLLNCFIQTDKTEKILLGQTRCTHYMTENSSDVLIERSIQVNAPKYAGDWDTIECYMPVESLADEERAFRDGYLDLYAFPFDFSDTKASRVTSAKRKLQALKNRIELAMSRIAGIYLEDKALNLILQDPVWEKRGLSPDGFSGFEFQGLILDQHEIAVGDTNNEVHNNILYLVKRMDDALIRGDHASVIHTSASIFETMAKDIVGVATIQNQTLKSFFSRYRMDSHLPPALLDYVIGVYDSRNSIPLAGHGSTQSPSLTTEETVTICEITKAIVRTEYKLRRLSHVKTAHRLTAVSKDEQKK